MRPLFGLSQQVLASNGRVFDLEIDPFRKKCLMEGLDEISLAMEQGEKISAFEQRQELQQPWLYD